jgi:nicotinate phosphoribosyltransferase
MSALNTDLYQLTMAAGFFMAGKAGDIATFELMVRRLPENRNFLVTAGLQQAVEYLLDFRFRGEEIDYIRSLGQFENAPPEFFRYLADLRFTGDFFAMREGTPAFPNEPIAIVRAPLIQAQIIETYLLSTLAHQTSVASKAARCVIAANGRSIVEFGSRRAHSPYAGIMAGRAAYIGGCDGTSNAQAGMLFGIPVFGTAAHSWTMAFDEEEESFRVLQQLLVKYSVFLIDTYDTIAGAHLAARVGRPMWGVRLDSGDLDTLSREVRRILDDAGLRDVKIMATNDLDEHRIQSLVHSGAPIDSFGVGTQLSTSGDAPALGAVYKLVELDSNGVTQYTAKFSGQKSTLPAAKQVYRYPHCDTVALFNECNFDFKGEPLLRPVISKGELVEPLPSAAAARSYCQSAVAALPKRLFLLDQVVHYDTTISPRLLELAESVRSEHREDEWSEARE